jgi:predicted ester cyclase
MSPEIYRSLARSFFAEQDRLRGGPAPALCAEGYSAHLPGIPPLSLAGHQDFAAGFYSGFPDLRHEVELVAAEGDRAVVHFTLYGTHGGTFLGIAPTGTSITVSATACMHFEQGQVRELWAEFDQLGLLQQLHEAGERPPDDYVRGI